MPRIIAIDYGGKRCGIAVTDPLKIIATGLTTVPTTELMDFVIQYIKKEDVDCLVVGLPFRADGSLSLIAKQIKTFLDKIHGQLPNLRLEGVDESFTSQQAVQSLVQSGVPKKKRRQKELVDKVSATLILQRFLEQENE